MMKKLQKAQEKTFKVNPVKISFWYFMFKSIVKAFDYKANLSDNFRYISITNCIINRIACTLNILRSKIL